MTVCWFAGRYSQSLQHFPSRVPLPNYNPAGRTNGRHFFCVFRHCNWQHFVHGFNSIFCALFQSCALFQIKFAINMLQKKYGYTHSCRFVVRSLWSMNPNFLNLRLPDNLDVDVLEKISQHRFSLAFFAWFLASACAIMQSVISLSASACASRRLCSFFIAFIVVVTVIWGICFMLPFLFLRGFFLLSGLRGSTGRLIALCHPRHVTDWTKWLKML